MFFSWLEETIKIMHDNGCEPVYYTLTTNVDCVNFVYVRNGVAYEFTIYGLATHLPDRNEVEYYIKECEVE